MAYPDLMSALKGYLTGSRDLVYALRGPYTDEVPQGEPAPEGDAPPYVVISQTGSGQEGGGTRGSYIDWSTYDFKVYHLDEDLAVGRAAILADTLDRFNRKPRPTFIDGSYLMSWLRNGGPPMKNKVPDSQSAGQRTLYRVVYTYRARVGGLRRVAVP